MPVLPASLLALWLPLQSAAATPGRTPFDLATELLMHEELDTNERWALQYVRDADYYSRLSPEFQSSRRPLPSPNEVRLGYRFRLQTRPFTAVPETPGWTGIHGFCSEAPGRICYTERGVDPSGPGGRCAPSCRELPPDGASLLVPPKFSADEAAALIAAFEAKEIFPDYPGTVERLRAMLAQLSRPAAGEKRAHSVSAVAFTPDGSALISADFVADTATLWSISSGRPLGRLDTCEGIHDVLVTPDGRTALTACKTAVKLWSLPDWSPRGTLGRFDRMTSVGLALDGSGKRLATLSGARAELWQIPSGVRAGSIETAPADKALGGRGALSPDGSVLVTGGVGQPTVLWSLPQGKRLATLEDGEKSAVAALAISPDGRTLAAAYSSGVVALWALPDGRVLARRHEHGYPVNGLAFSADGRSLVTASSDHSVKVWSLPEAKVRQALRGHADEVYAVAVSSTGLIASADSHGVVRLWDLATGAPKGELVDTSPAPTRPVSRRPRP